jgi:hypothetical protein
MGSAPEDRGSGGAAPRELPRSRRKGKWTIGFIGRSKRVREAAVRDALKPHERIIATYPMEAARGRGASSGLRFGQHGLALVTPDRLIVVVVNLGPRITINPLVLLVSVIVHGLVPVRRPYLLFEMPLGDLDVEVKGGLSGRYVNLRISDSEWVLRFGQGEKAAEFTRLVTAGADTRS